MRGFVLKKIPARTRKKKRKAKVNLRTKADSLHSSQSSLFVLGRVISASVLWVKKILFKSVFLLLACWSILVFWDCLFGWHIAIPIAFTGGDKPLRDLCTAPAAKQTGLNVCCDLGVILLCSLAFYCLYTHSLCLHIPCHCWGCSEHPPSPPQNNKI